MKNNLQNIIQVTNSDGIIFNLRKRLKGDNHGRDMALIYQDERPVIEFFDARYTDFNHINGCKLGYFVSSYFAETIDELKPVRGINLAGEHPQYHVSGANILDIKDNFCLNVTII